MATVQCVIIIWFMIMAGYYNVIKKDLLKFLLYAFLVLTFGIQAFH